MKVCNVKTNLYGAGLFYIESKEDTIYNQFIVEISTFRNPTTSVTVNVDATLQTLNTKTPAGGAPPSIPYTYAFTDSQTITTPLSVTSPTSPATNLAALSITKKFNYFGVTTEFTFNLITTTYSILYDSVIKITFGMNYDIEYGQIIHHSGKSNGSKYDQLFAHEDANKRHTLKVTGFTNGVSAGSGLSFAITGLSQPFMVGLNGGASEEIYVAVYDPSGVLMESGRAGVGVGTIMNHATIDLFYVEDFAFSGADTMTYTAKHTGYIRMTSNLTFGFGYGGTVGAGGFVHVFLNMFQFEYMV